MINPVGVFFIDGFEEIEAVTIVDVLRRAEFDVILIGVNNTLVTGAHGICVKMDQRIEDVSDDELGAGILPGGMPGASNLAKDKRVLTLIQRLDRQNKNIGAICAAPIALHSAGLVNGRKITCYPTFQHQLPNSEYTGDPVTVDGNIITGKGAGAALQFSLKLVEVLGAEERAVELRHQMIMD